MASSILPNLVETAPLPKLSRDDRWFDKSTDGELAKSAVPSIDSLPPAKHPSDRNATAFLKTGRLPYFTFVLSAVLIFIFVVQAWTAPEPLRALVAFQPIVLVKDGGLVWLLVAKGQVWRLFTAPFLHGSFGHVGANFVALILGGFLLERLVGWRWYALSFCFGALAGGLMSLLLNPTNMVSVGASGGILGLFATTFVVAFRFDQTVRNALLILSLRIVVPSMLPFLGSVHGAKTDLAAHFGGLIGGALIGLLVLTFWNRKRAEPSKGGLAVAIPVVGFFLVAATFFCGEAWWAWYKSGLLAQKLPPSFAELKGASDALLTSYPHDPRVRYAHAAQLYDQDKPEAAKTELQAALTDVEMLELQPISGAMMHVLLSQIEEDAGNMPAAKAAAMPVCGSTNLQLRQMVSNLC